MIIEEILSKVSMKTPTLLLAIGIFILFWVSGICKFQYFISRKAMDIDGLGEKLVGQLIEAGLVENPADLYDLEFDRLVDLERMAPLSANNLLQALNKSKQTSLQRFIYALGIQEVGEAAATGLAHHFGDLQRLRIADQETLQAVPDIGPIVAEKVRHFFGQSKNIQDKTIPEVNIKQKRDTVRREIATLVSAASIT